MKLKTSFFEPTVLKKDITRFWPLWGLYGLFALLFVLLMWESNPDAARMANNASEVFLSMGVLNFLYAPLAAFFLFGDLFKSRMCNALHALPLRREGWFLTHLCAGMLFCIVPNGIAAGLTAALLGKYAWIAGLWLCLMVMQYIFFFGVATFACYCSGNTLGALALYGIINFLAVLVGWLFVTFYQPLLYGIKPDFYEFARYSPVVRFCDANYLETHYDNMTDSLVFENFVPADWRFAGITAGVGVALLALALLVYRIRNLESAGDFIAFRPAAPVFLVLYTFLAGTVLYYIASSMAEALEYIFLFIGLGVGFFTGRMLLERKVNVFRGKSFLAFGILVAVFYGTLGLTALDPVGITRYVPEPENIKYVTICRSHYVYDLRRNTVTLKDTEDVKTITNIHQACIDDPFDIDSNESRTPIFIRYELENGTAVERYYYIPSESEHDETLMQYFTSVEAVFNNQDPKTVLHNLRMIEVFSYELNCPLIAVAKNEDYLNIDHYDEKYPDGGQCISYYVDQPAQDEMLVGLFEAIKTDCGQGDIAPSGVMYDKPLWGHITLRYLSGTNVNYLDIEIYADCEATIEYLKSLQPVKEPTPEG